MLVHYADLQADLEGEMRRLAGLLGIAIGENIWPGLVAEARFDRMRERAGEVAPQVTIHGLWPDPSRFLPPGDQRPVAGVSRVGGSGQVPGARAPAGGARPGGLGASRVIGPRADQGTGQGFHGRDRAARGATVMAGNLPSEES